ncbi:uncharacterized protein [Solanum tuberosum]|uniref:uncharacterized protein n=1 Tax=Solanum tuberosum TaxID=4113 RepID=UPI00073A3CDE|nr:PREDICTED: uncharacterized protein LOC107061304 [Solanum tuberosum]
MIQFKGDERLIHFLMGLNDTYAPARSNILMINPLPTVNHAYSLLMQDENQRENHLSSQFPGDSSSFMVGKSAISENQLNTQQKSESGSGFNYQQKPGNTYFKGNISYKGKKSNQLCNYCKMTNHTIDNCYRLIGFPADFKFTKSKKFQGTVRSNSTTSMEEPDGNQSILASSKNPNVAQQLSLNQFTQLVHLLKHIQEGKPVGSEVNVNSAAGPFLEEPSSFW